MNQDLLDLAVPLTIFVVGGLGIWWQRRYGKERQLSAKLVKKERRILLFKTRPRPVLKKGRWEQFASKGISLWTLFHASIQYIFRFFGII